MLLVAALLTACSEDYDDWASPQGYDPEGAIQVVFSVAPAADIDFANVQEESMPLFIPSISTIYADSNEPAAATVEKYEVVLDDAVAIDVDDAGYANVDDINSAVSTIYGKRPETHTLAVNVTVYLSFGEEVVAATATTTLTVTLAAPFIASAYYLVGDMCGWDEESMIPFSHSDADVYDDPVFTVSFSTEENKYWKIIPQTNIDSGDFWYEGEEGVVGVVQDGDTSLSGTLYAGPGVGAGCIAIAGQMRMTINMMDYTYTIEPLASEYYMTGNPNGWASDYGALFFPVSTTEYSYTSYYNGSWDVKFWDKDNVGDWDNIYGCSAAEDNNQAWNGTIVYSNGDQGLIGCITSPTEGYYTLYINMGEMTYYWEQLSDQSPAEYGLVSITGDFNSWSDYIDMAQVAPHNWYVEAEIPSDGGLKFLVDHEWDVNWGVALDVADTNYGVGVQNGDNITVPAGKYRIYLNDINGQFVFIAE